MIISTNSTYRLMVTNLERISANIQTLQTQGASGVKLNAPSDDPTAIGPVIASRQQLTQNQRYITTMGSLSQQMASTDTYLDNVNTILTKAQTTVNSAINSTLTSSDLGTLADQIDQYKAQLLDSANASINGQYLFAGDQVTTQPFTVNPNYSAATYNPNDSTTWPVLYNGSAKQISVGITPGETVQTNITGNQLFLGISNANWNGTTTAASNQPEPGKVDIFTALTQASEALRSGNTAAMATSLTNLQTAASQSELFRAQLGNQAARVSDATQQQQSVQTDIQQTISNYQDADSVATFSDLTNMQTAYQAALSITAQISKISILNYM
jgi:flagellar hook-associated protein 3 FlgL